MQITSYYFHVVWVPFLNAKSKKNKRKKLRDNVVSDEDLAFHCGISFFSFFYEGKCIFYFCFNIKTLSSIQNTFPLRNCLFIFNSKWSSHKCSTSGEKKITWVRLLISINNTKSHFNETAGSWGLKEREMSVKTDGLSENKIQKDK